METPTLSLLCNEACWVQCRLSVAIVGTCNTQNAIRSGRYRLCCSDVYMQSKINYHMFESCIVRLQFYAKPAIFWVR